MEGKIGCFLVEDDVDDQEIFLMCLNMIDKNIVCRIANNGEEAIKMLQAQPEYIPDLIFLDVNMPKMNGVECLREIKQMDRLDKSRIFMYSTTSEENVFTTTQQLGADEFIVKPARVAELKEKLAKIFRICQEAADVQNREGK